MTATMIVCLGNIGVIHDAQMVPVTIEIPAHAWVSD